MWMFLIGVFVGVLIGIVAAALCVIASEERSQKGLSLGPSAPRFSGGHSSKKTIQDN